MKTNLTLLTLLGLLALTGCSADDLAGPDAVSDAPLAQAGRSDTAPSAPDAEVLSVAGTWQAADDAGSITLFIDELGPPPNASIDAARQIDGQGVVTGSVRTPIVVTVDGTFDARAIAFTISDDRGAIAKAEGVISRDFSLLKVILYDGSDRERPLTFERF